MGHQIFAGRKVVIATKHKKEQVIAPLLSSQLGVKPFVSDIIDTDQFGTFSGEISRKLDPFSTAREKCLLAMELTGCDLAIASEGSFGMHPVMYFAPCDEELVLLVDQKHKLEIAEKVLSTETNFDGQEVRTIEELDKFVRLVGFPEHAVIIRNAKDDTSFLRKGISSFDELYRSFEQVISQSSTAYVETDMRAMHNPKRMEVIRQVTEKLVQRALTLCPECRMPGFGVTDREEGLPCEWCGQPTRSTLYYIHSCSKCGYIEHIPNDKKEKEDPMYCDFCNP